jgi:hypothetical protein
MPLPLEGYAVTGDTQSAVPHSPRPPVACPSSTQASPTGVPEKYPLVGTVRGAPRRYTQPWVGPTGAPAGVAGSAFAACLLTLTRAWDSRYYVESLAAAIRRL